MESLAQRLRLYKRPPSPDQQNGISKPRRNSVSRESDSIAEPPDHQARRLDRAAVLICLFQGPDGDIRVILTKRSSKLSSHAGEVALPGGKREEGDTGDVVTALREAKEEIGLDPSLVDVVTVLEPVVSKNFLTVVPVVGILHDKNAFCPVPNAAEVEAVFDAPLEMFLKDENRRELEKEWMGNKYLLHFFDYETEIETYVIWALSAGILISAASLVYQRPPAFLERRPKFWSRVADQEFPKL